jgi:hypothetical protein
MHTLQKGSDMITSAQKIAPVMVGAKVHRQFSGDMKTHLI